jgi:glycosyltransferase involved in cell wall biosynthesis
VIEHFWCAPYVNILRSCCDKVALDLHNIESWLLATCASSGDWWIRSALRRFSRSCRTLEEQLIRRFTNIITVSEQDLLKIREIHPEVSGIVYPNAIPFIQLPGGERRDEIVFSGNLEYQPNMGAISFFYDKVWPRLRAQWPALRWRLIGKNADAFRKRFARDKSVCVTGEVEDAVAAISESRVAIAPLLAGSGTRVKIIEAWAAGVPVVSTTVGAEGLPFVDGQHILISDTPAAFAESVSRLLSDRRLERRVGQAGRALYENQLTWDAAWRRLHEAGF